MLDKLAEVELIFKKLESALSSPEVLGNPSRFQSLSISHSQLQPIVETYRALKDVHAQLEETTQLAATESGELKEMAEKEKDTLSQQHAELEQKMRVLLLPKDPNDQKNILLEIRPAAGGDEAGIFAGDLMRMYNKFAEAQGWQVETMSVRTNDVGGYKEIIQLIRGNRVYSRLKYESGVHRVQRVPKTETQGRVHTSTVTVAVLPEAEDVEINIDPTDLRVDVYRSSGPGGQSVNTTDSAVRITHIPTGLVVTCQDEKSQHKNRAKALKVLKTRLLDAERQKQQQERSATRLSQVGSGDRSEKIRTYNFPQGRVSDHRIGVTLYSIGEFMNGDIGALIDQLSAHDEAEALKSHTVESTLKEIVDLKENLGDA